MLKRYSVLALMALIPLCSQSHDLLPGQTQSQPQLITNATVHTPTGPLLNTDVLLKAGKIASIGTDIVAEGAAVIDASGKHLYPALISLDSQIGLTEIGAVRATVDSYEVGEINPQIRAATAFNVESELLPTLRANGIGYAQITPIGDLFAGQSALVQLDGWNINDALVKADTGVHLYWPASTLPQGQTREQAQANYQRQYDIIVAAFDDAKHYLQVPREIQDARWESMRALLQGTSTLFVHADERRQIEHAMALAAKYQVQLVIVGGYDSHQVAEQLAQQQVAVIYTHAKGLPRRIGDPYDLAFEIPAILHHAGVELAITFSGSWESRNLPFAVGQAIAFGLPPTAALNSVSKNAAKLLGQPQLGQLIAGAPASVIISGGDLFDPSKHAVERMWLDGRAIDLDNRHQRLYQKYQQRYQ
ncbi:amidohydrolase [Ferrimonas lipolytica]|uniref:Amidohydrolase n=1 Tax=Ferrimonas lipolytica TaxID=2724191 RepID=A0A6H1UHV5_9GAMM|nr:amidohydrolase [Ferrimonas lipolytica]QIZ77372.1 amidohydrolase [Ferrimonas lipolytica]